MANTSPANWPATTNGTYTAIMTGWHEVQNPKVRFAAYIEADAGTTGNFRIVVDGTGIDSAQTVVGGASGTITAWQASNVDLPAGTVVGGTAVVSMEARRTAGTGSVRAHMLMWSGDQS